MGHILCPSSLQDLSCKHIYLIAHVADPIGKV